VAYNVVLAAPDLRLARDVAAAVRGPALRALGLRVGADVQVSMNLVRPREVGPADAFDAVAARAPVREAELVGLLPEDVLRAVDPARWPALDLAEDRTIESRLRGRS
jgi:glutamate formiminotransferase